MISIIIPIYKVEAYLEKCIQSVMAQTYQDIEIILVDDGSPDSCGLICDRYAQIDNRIQVIHKKNGGLSDARNKGIEIARGEYIGFVDSDDCIDPHMYELLLENLQRTDSNLSVCGFQWLNEGVCPGEPGDNICRVYEGEDLLACLAKDNLNTVIACNKIYKKELFYGNRYTVGRMHEDEFIIHHILYKAKKAVYTDAALYFYMKRESSIVNQINIKHYIDTWDAYEDRCGFLKKLSEVAYCSARRQQLAIAIRYYFKLISSDCSSEKNMSLDYRKKFLTLFSEKKLWVDASYLEKNRWITFAVSPLFCKWYMKKRFGINEGE